jgi:hypothetical protein
LLVTVHGRQKLVKPGREWVKAKIGENPGKVRENKRGPDGRTEVGGGNPAPEGSRRGNRVGTVSLEPCAVSCRHCNKAGHPRTPKEIMEILQIFVTRPGLAKPGPAKLEQAKPVPANPAASKPGPANSRPAKTGPASLN